MNDFFQNTYLQSALDWIKTNYIKIILVVLILSIAFGWIYYRNLVQEENSKKASILFDEFNFILNKNFIFFEELKYEFLGDAELKSSNQEAARKNYKTALELTSSEIHKELIRIKLSSIIN